MTTTLPPDRDETRPERARSPRSGVIVALALTILVVGVVVGVLLLAPGPTPGGGVPPVPSATGAAPATTAPPASTAAGPSTTPGAVTTTPGRTTTASGVPADAVTAVWPTAAVRAATAVRVGLAP